MKTLAARLAQLEQRIGSAGPQSRVIFVTGGETTADKCDAFLAKNGISIKPRDILFLTTYEAKPGSDEAPTPLRIVSINSLDGRPLTA
ncbi:hypothetical protein [Aureimonas psammosilenae]|uniref:hypothetical protein n=1 Tax=Aureimonas psammosilenae TaxID=2495496 RepID=UPI001260B46C|nr:hypothetical protein [Aureimonas psammosilenae]